MKLKQWLKKNKMNPTDLSKEIEFSRDYCYKISAGIMSPGRKLCKTICEYTKGQVTAEDLGYIEKERNICPTCGHHTLTKKVVGE
jgi:hypothetical protein